MGRHRARRTIAGALCAAVALLAVPATAAAADAPDDPAATTTTTSTTAVEPVEAPERRHRRPGRRTKRSPTKRRRSPTPPAGPRSPSTRPNRAPATDRAGRPSRRPTEPTATTGRRPTPSPRSRAELPGPAPTIEARCWMGHHQPVYVLRNLDRDHALRYVLSAPGAGKRGQLTPRGDGRDSVWFVGTGSFPNPATVRADFEIGGASGSVVAPEVLPAYCTYAVRPIVRWLDADFNDVMPTAEQVAGWSLTVEGALGSLDCTWNGAGLTCRYAANAGWTSPRGQLLLARPRDRAAGAGLRRHLLHRPGLGRPRGLPARRRPRCDRAPRRRRRARPVERRRSGRLVLPRPPPGRHRHPGPDDHLREHRRADRGAGHLDRSARPDGGRRPGGRPGVGGPRRRGEPVRHRPSRCRRPVVPRWLSSGSAWRCWCSGWARASWPRGRRAARRVLTPTAPPR